MKVTHEKMRSELQKQIRDFQRGATYGSGIAIETAGNLPGFVKDDDDKLKPLKSQRCPLLGCLGRNHSTSASKACRYYDCADNDEYFEKVKKYLMEKYPDKYGEYLK